LGVDVAKKIDSTVLTVVQKFGDAGKVVYLKELQNRSYIDITNWIDMVNKAFKIEKVYLDATGVGDPVGDILQEKGVPFEPDTIW